MALKVHPVRMKLRVASACSWSSHKGPGNTFVIQGRTVFLTAADSYLAFVWNMDAHFLVSRMKETLIGVEKAGNNSSDFATAMILG